jgi:cyclopropane fatty-acyl-phospholipid synthase-like methyltransferase
MSTSDNITRYYDSNTRRFLRYGHGGKQLAIHRAVWADGAGSRAEAMHYVDSRIAEIALGSGASRILDIGCGVGGSLLYLADKTGAETNGVTLSPVQAEFGDRLLAESDYADRTRIIRGDFLDPQTSAELDGPFDLAMAVESLIHMQDPAAFFRSAAALLRPGGKLVVCDDFLSAAVPRSDAERRLLDRFSAGWHTAGLRSTADAVTLASLTGLELENDEDLSGYLELGRPRDRLIRLVVALTTPLPLRSPFWSNLRGGDALQSLLRSGALSYRLLVFSRTPF